MEELFRFSITRAAERTHAATLPLARSTQFQDELVEIAARPRLLWSHLQAAALGFITNEDNVNWILNFNSQAPASPVPALKQLLTDLQLVTSASQPSEWLTPIGTAK